MRKGSIIHWLEQGCKPGRRWRSHFDLTLSLPLNKHRICISAMQSSLSKQLRILRGACRKSLQLITRPTVPCLCRDVKKLLKQSSWKSSSDGPQICAAGISPSAISGRNLGPGLAWSELSSHCLFSNQMGMCDLYQQLVGPTKCIQMLVGQEDVVLNKIWKMNFIIAKSSQDNKNSEYE